MTFFSFDRTASCHLTREERLERLRQLCVEAERRGLKIVAQAWQRQADHLESQPDLGTERIETEPDHEPEAPNADQLDLDFGGEL